AWEISGTGQMDGHPLGAHCGRIVPGLQIGIERKDPGGRAARVEYFALGVCRYLPALAFFNRSVAVGSFGLALRAASNERWASAKRLALRAFCPSSRFIWYSAFFSAAVALASLGIAFRASR